MNLTDEEKIQYWDRLIEALENLDLEVVNCGDFYYSGEGQDKSIIITIEDFVNYLKEYE